MTNTEYKEDLVVLIEVLCDIRTKLDDFIRRMGPLQGKPYAGEITQRLIAEHRAYRDVLEDLGKFISDK